MMRDIVSLTQHNSIIKTTSRERKQPRKYLDEMIGFKPRVMGQKPRVYKRRKASGIVNTEKPQQLRTYINKRG